MYISDLPSSDICFNICKASSFSFSDKLFNSLDNCEKIETDFEKAISYNPSYFKSVAEPKYRKYFFDNFEKYEFSIYNKIQKKQQPSLLRRIASRLKELFIH